MKYEVYTDGSATTADKPGGWAFVILRDGTEIHRQSGFLASATNNVAEISAAIEGLQFLRASYLQQNPITDEVVLVSDSQLVLRYATGQYKCKAVHLVPLYIKLRKGFRDVKASTRWVKGHAGDEFNEICDKLAKAARQGTVCSGGGPSGQPNNPIDTVEST